MSDIDELWKRIDEAKRRLGVIDQAEVSRIAGLNDRLKAVQGSLSRRHREVAAQEAERVRLRHENEQLRGMLHKLLAAIEERYGGRLKDILQDLEGRVSALIPLAGIEDAARPAELGPDQGAPERDAEDGSAAA